VFLTLVDPNFIRFVLTVDIGNVNDDDDNADDDKVTRCNSYRIGQVN